MLHADGDAGQGVHASSELFSDGHRAVLSTGAADGDRRVSLVLLTVPREHGTQRGQICRDECIRIGLTEETAPDPNRAPAPAPDQENASGIDSFLRAT